MGIDVKALQNLCMDAPTTPANMRGSKSRSLFLARLPPCSWGPFSLSQPARRRRDPNTHGVFNVNCSFSHRAPDDPIVFPGLPGASHSHDFAGNVDTDASSTPKSLRAGTTNCEHYAPGTGRKGDQAGYWFPTLYVAGLPVSPTRVTAYYQSAERNTSKIKPFPKGLKMIAGDRTGVVDYRRLGADFSCSNHKPLVPRTRTVAPTLLRPGSTLVGERSGSRIAGTGGGLDSRNHKSAYGVLEVGRATATPARRSHRVMVPQLDPRETSIPRSGGPTTRLASGDMQVPWHADFMNGWTMRKHIQLLGQRLPGAGPLILRLAGTRRSSPRASAASGSATAQWRPSAD